MVTRLPFSWICELDMKVKPAEAEGGNTCFEIFVWTILAYLYYVNNIKWRAFIIVWKESQATLPFWYICW